MPRRPRAYSRRDVAAGRHVHRRCSCGCRAIPAGRFCAVALATAAWSAVPSAPPIQQLEEIEVIGVTPLPGLDMPASQVPLDTQSAQADDVAELHGQSITGLLQQN